MGGMLGVSYYKASQQVTNVLNVLASHDGQIDKDSVTQVTVQKRFGPNTSKESLFQYRYFSVFFDKSGNITKKMCIRDGDNDPGREDQVPWHPSP